MKCSKNTKIDFLGCKPNVLIVGNTSFIAKAFLNYHQKELNLFSIKYTDINSIDFSKFDVVVNCALNPLYKTEKYNIANDIDLQIIKLIQNTNCHYIMISSRKVYGNSTELVVYNEEDEYNPFDYYSENKMITEKYLMSIQNNITILRGSNLFGFEYDRKSFLGYCMTNLVKTKSIIYDVNLSTQRDFIYINDFIKVLIKVCIFKPKGIFNVGSGFGLKIVEISKYLIAGYGIGSYSCVNERYDQQFILNIDKITNFFGFNIELSDNKKIIINLGKDLWKI